MSISRHNRENTLTRRHAGKNTDYRFSLEWLEGRILPDADPVATLLNVPSEQLLGENLQFTVRFDNASPTDVGFGPYVDLYLPATGVDGASSLPNDGITFVNATYLGTPVTATVLTLTASGVPHPYAKDASGAPLLITPPAGFVLGDQLVVLQVPFGSFTPTQNPADITVTTSLSNLADVNAPLPIQVQGGFRFGNDAFDNPTTDPSLVGPVTSSNVTPTIYQLTKTYIGPEDETTTGPNYPRQYQISVNVADGQVLTDLDLTDVLPAELQFLAVDSTSGPTSDISTPSTTTPGGTLTRRFASITGTSGAVDAQMTFSFYVPRVTPPLSPILDPATGDDLTVTDDARATATWTPLDPRDPTQTVTSDVTPVDHSLTLKSIAVQKQMTIVVDTGAPGLSPGDTVEYTLNFQVSDYFAFQNVVLNDLFSDGQNYIDGSATLTVNDGHGVGGTTSGVFAPTNVTLMPNVVGGSDRLLLNVSAELDARGFSTNGQLVGGAIPVGGTGVGPPQSEPPTLFGPTQGQVKFRTVIQTAYEIIYPSGNASLNPGDPISNDVTVSGDLLAVTDLQPNGNSEDDTSSASDLIQSGAFTKSVYAVNGVINSTTTPTIKPGDTVTYRLQLTLPTGDVENLRIEDFLPLPIFDVDTTGMVSGFDDIVSAAVPSAGRAKFGPNDTFRAMSGIVPSVMNTSLANSVTFDYGTNDDPTNTPATVDILFTVTVSTDPFADQLLLSNGALATSNNTFLEDSSTEGIAQVVLQEPVLNITKGVVATDNPAGVFTPATVGPVAFNAPGTLGPRFTGTITSAGLAANPIDSNLGNVDQGDLVTFAVVVENTGSAPNGAFDIVLRDTLPEGFVIPGIGANGINLHVTDGAGNPIAFEVVESGSNGILGAIRLIDPSPTMGAIGPGVVNGVTVQDGSNIVIITFDLRTNGNTVSQIITDEAVLSNYSNTEGGPDFTAQDLTDDANVQIAAPSMTKELIGTEIVNTTNANNEAVIGELVTYRLRITVPEGITPNAVLTDTLDSELAYVDTQSTNIPAQVLLQGGSLTAVITNNGRTITWTLSNIVNNNSSNGTPEVIEIVYRAVVVNTVDSNANDLVNNSAKLAYQGGPQIQVAAPNVRIIEPQVKIDKSVSVNGSGTSGDAGDPFVYTIVLSNPPGANQFTADAFDLTFQDLFLAGLAGSPLGGLSFTVTDTAGIVTAANFELVTDPVTNQLVLRTTTGGEFDLPVSASRTITIQVNGTLTQTVTPGQVIPNEAEVRWTSLDGDPGIRSPFNPNSTERNGSGGVNDYVAEDGANITVTDLELSKTVVSTSETATVDPEAVVVGEIVRYRVEVAIPDFGNPTPFQFVDLLPAGMQLVSAGTGKVALVSNAGDNLVSTTLTDPDPMNPPDLYLTGNETNVGMLVPVFPIPMSILSITTVNGRQQITFDLGDVTNPATMGQNDHEYVVVEFNVLVTNVADNQAGTQLVNQVTTVQAGMPTDTVYSTPLRIAEPSITNLAKELVQPVGMSADPLTPDAATHDAGDLIHYAVSYSNDVGANVSTAYDVNLVDALPSAKMTLQPGSIRVFRNNVLINTGFTNNSAGNTVNVVVDQVDPGDSIVVVYDVILTSNVIAGELVPNTANLTYTSLPGANGTVLNPTGAANTGTPGSMTGERDGSDGIGGTLNDYAGTAMAMVPILIPDLDKIILDTNVSQTGSGQFDPNLTDLTVGETVTYRITITLPEGTTTLSLSDVLPLLNNGTVALTSATVVAIGANITGSSLAVGAPGVVSGNQITFNFGTVVNSPDNAVTEADQIVVDVIGQVTDLPENVAGTTVTNTATLTYNNGSLTDDAVAEVVEPVLDIQKTVTPGSGDAGDVFTYTVTVTHLPTSTGPAFQVFIRDLLNTGNLVLIPGSVMVSLPGFLVTSGNGASDTTVTVAGNILLLGDSLTITYQAQLTGTPAPTDVVPNTATLEYGSYFPALGGRSYSDEDPAQITVNTNTIAGLIYRDLNNNGVYEPGAGETLITDSVTLQLSGTDHIGNPVNLSVTTTTGSYLFDHLRPSGPSGYTITQVNQPTGFLDGKDTPGTPFGGIGTSGGNPRDTDAITGVIIPVGVNTAGENYNFGELVPATVGDFVWVDTNGNGRQDGGEPGLDGVSVTLLGTDDLGAVNLSTTTASGGLYQFANLRPGTYRLVFGTLPNYFRTFQNSPLATDLTDSDADPVTGLTADFTLVQGQTDTSIDAGLYMLADIGDFVWYDVNSDGVQDAGEPGIPGVTLALDYAGIDGAFGTMDDATGIATQSTDVNGGYRFSDQQPGTYRVRVLTLTLPNALTQPTFDYDGIATAHQADLMLESGVDNLDIDFGYSPSADLAAQLGDLVWYDVNRDGSSAGEPGIAGVTVNATWFGFDGIEGTSDDTAYTTVTNLVGIYGFQPLPLGRYRVSVDGTTLPPSLVPTYDFDSGLVSPDNTTLAELTPLNLTELQADFGYTGRAAFGDRVWLDSNGDGVQDPGEPGIAGVTVTATWAGPDGLLGTTADNTTLTTVTGVDGIYGFTNLPAGTWRATITAGLPAAITITGDPDGTLDGETDFALLPLGTRSDIDFGYHGHNSLSGYVYRDFNVNGLREPNGLNPETGISGVTITLTASDMTGFRFTSTITTAADGSYRFDGLPDGDFLIDETQPPSVFQAGQAGYYDGLDTIGTAGGNIPTKNQFAVQFTADIDGEEYNFGENPPADPFGNVYVDLNGNGLRESGEPGIPGITITISGIAFPGTLLERPLTAADVPGGLSVVTDADGRWIFPIVPPGVYTIIEGPTPGFLDGEEHNGDPNPPATVVVGNDRFDNIVLTPFTARGPFDFGELLPASISGMVYLDNNRNGARDNNEPGIASVTVTLTGMDDRGASVTQQLVTDANGRFLFVGLRPGTYTLIETQPVQYNQGVNTIGSAGGNEVDVDVLGSIRLGPGVNAVDYLFGEVNPRPTPVPPLPPLPIPPIPIIPIDPSKRSFLSSTLPLPPLPEYNEQTEPDYQALHAVRPFGDAIYVATAEGVGGGLVRVFDMTGGQERFRFTPFPGFTGGIRVATADVTGDYIPDIVVAAGPGGGPRVVIYDGNTGAILQDFFAFEPSFTGGVFVAAGDLDHDGVADLVLSPDLGGGPRVRVLASGDPSRILADFLGIDNASFRGGVRTAVGDFNGDGKADLAVAAGAGGGPQVAVFDGDGLSDGSLRKLVPDFFAFEDTLRNGVYLAAGDIDGDGADDLVVGAGPGGGPRVTAFSGRSFVATGGLVPIANFMSGWAGDRSGVPVTTKDIDGDGRAEIVTGAGEGQLPVVRFFDPPTGQQLDAFFAEWAEFTGGIFVG